MNKPKTTAYTGAEISRATQCILPVDPGDLSYAEIYTKDCQMLSEFVEQYGQEYAVADTQRKKELYLQLKELYEDPDGKALATYPGCDVLCSADALISVYRLTQHVGITDGLVEGFRQTRELPTIFWPREFNGINMSRAFAFGDRIDATLFDLKQYFDTRDTAQCRLKIALELPKTANWLDAVGSFENLVKWLDIEGILVNENLEVYNLEYTNGTTLTSLSYSYPRAWTDTYFNNAMEKSMQLIERARKHA